MNDSGKSPVGHIIGVWILYRHEGRPMACFETKEQAVAYMVEIKGERIGETIWELLDENRKKEVVELVYLSIRSRK